MSAIEESGIPLEVHLSEWKKMLKLAEKGGDLVFETQAKGRIKELEGLIEQNKPEVMQNIASYFAATIDDILLELEYIKLKIGAPKTILIKDLMELRGQIKQPKPEEKKIVWSRNKFSSSRTFVSHCIYFSIGTICAFLNRDGMKPYPDKFVLYVNVMVEGFFNHLIYKSRHDSFEEAENRANKIARKMELL